MKSLFFLPFLCLSLMLNAQNEKFYYEYKSIQDSTKQDKVSKEMMLLEATPKGSIFYSYKQYRQDSINIDEIRKGSNYSGTAKMISKTTRFFGEKSNGKVSKTYPDYSVTLHTYFGNGYYKIPDDRKIEWKILPEKEKIGEWNAQKAIGKFAGREWVAWYVEDIPIPDGPYKFHGLPGLIVKIADTKNQHSYELVGISKITDDIASAKEIYRPKEIELTTEQYKKVFWENRDDPAKQMKQMILSNANINMTLNGNQVSDKTAMLKIFEESEKERIQKDNNHLEIDMLKR